MIYLIDDKKIRQEGYGWSSVKLERYSELIAPYYTYDEISDIELRKKMFSNDNIIMIHESFFNNPANVSVTKDFEIIRKDLYAYAQSNPHALLVFFSGSIASRKKDENVAYMPVSLFYQNLEVFVNNQKKNEKQLDYLFFGKNFDFEEKLFKKLLEANNNIDDLTSSNSQKTNLYIRPTQNFIQNPLEKYENKFVSNKVEDNDLNEKINEWFSETKYENIFIPLCFGATLSDFNGLRLASMIRCTKSKNQLSNIFIYGFVGVEYLYDNEYFNILKTKNVELIDYKKASFKTAVEKESEPLLIGELSREISKLKLEVPDNYEDNHSIANEWAIYRWANTVEAQDKDIEQIENKVENQLYFKYLQTIFPVSNIPKIEENKLKIKNLQDSKILYIDDDADKGWYEIFCKILVDVNEVQEFDYLGDELKDKSQEEIINLSLDKIKEQDTDIVILDFRLHENDFTDDISEVTGLKILKEIKKINPGIQVIIFSATNKIWNLQALQNAGADGFIVKESPENSVESKFTEEIIRSFTYELDIANKKKFLKNVFVSLDKIDDNVCNTDYIDDTSFESLLHLLSSQINIIKSAAKKIDINDKSTLDIIFLNCFNFLENFKNEYYLNYQNYSYSIGINEVSIIRYSYNTQFFIENNGLFLPNNQSDKPSFFITTANIMINYFELCNHNDIIITKLGKVTKYRNDFIHGTKHHFTENEIILILEILVLISSGLKE